MMPSIQINKLSLNHGSKSIVRNLSLSIQPGETFALLGINGAGKSSIVKAVLDFMDLASGDISINGINSTQSQSRQPLAFIPEKFTPPYYCTGQQFIDFTLAAHKSHNAQKSQALVLRYCELLNLDPHSLKQTIKSYSKGMCQKLGLIVVFAVDKPLYILDEPMSGLDPASRAQLRHVFSLLKAEGKTLFFCTHMLADVEAICDRIGILHQGKLSFVGSPAQCREQFNADSLELAFLNATGFSSVEV